MLPRERLINFGPETLSDDELLAVILRSGVKKKSVFELSKELLEKYSFLEISRKSYFELLEFDGISDAKACIIVALFEFCRRFAKISLSSKERVKIKNSKDIYDFVKYDFVGLSIELIIIVLLNSKNFVIRKVIVSEGTTNYALMNFKKILKLLLSYNASNFVIAHNHPSCCVEPSDDDIFNTLRLKRFCEVIGISLQDHIILGDENYFSFLDNGLLDQDMDEFF